MDADSKLSLIPAAEKALAHDGGEVYVGKVMVELRWQFRSLPHFCPIFAGWFDCIGGHCLARKGAERGGEEGTEITVDCHFGIERNSTRVMIHIYKGYGVICGAELKQ